MRWANSRRRPVCWTSSSRPGVFWASKRSKSAACAAHPEQAYHTGFPGPFMPKYLVLVLTLLLCSAPAQAQDAAAPFDNELQRFAEILGTLHYLRGICGNNEGGKWRNEMQALLDAETPSGERRARMIAGFNRGYNGFQQTYRACTPAATLAIRRYIDEGLKISRDLTARYAN